MIRLVYTNDLHGVFPWDLPEGDLWLDGGDAVGSFLPGRGPDPTLMRLRAAGCHAMVPGNHEFLHLGPEGLPEGPPLVCANLVRRDGVAVFPPSLAFETTGGRVGVVGVTVPWLKESDRPLRRLSARAEEFAAEWTLSDPGAAALAEGAVLRPQVDVLVGLTHLGRGWCREIARAGLFDVLLGAHTHSLHAPDRLPEGPWYAQNRPGGGHLVVTLP